MSDNNTDCTCMDSYFDYGEWVEFRLNTNVFGIVIGADIHGLMYTVQLAGSGLVQVFHGVTLQRMDDGGEPVGGKEAPVGENVIDFTKEKALRANTKTKGVA